MRVGSGTEELAQATEYIQIWNELVQLPCGQSELEILTPLLELDPWQVIDAGISVGARWIAPGAAWKNPTSPAGPAKAAAPCEAAFQQAGKPDPLRGVARRA